MDLKLKPEDAPEPSRHRSPSLPIDPEAAAILLAEQIGTAVAGARYLRDLYAHGGGKPADTQRRAHPRAVELYEDIASVRDTFEAMRIAQRRARSAAADTGAS